MPTPKGGTQARIPDELKKTRGTFNASVENKSRPRSPSRVPAAPDHLTPHQKWSWDRFAKVVSPMRITTDEDFASFEMMAILYSHWVRIHDVMRADERDGKPLTYETVNKYGTMRRMVPEFHAAGEIEPRLINLLGRFGLTPADRSRVSVIDGNDQTKNPEDEFN